MWEPAVCLLQYLIYLTFSSPIISGELSPAVYKRMKSLEVEGIFYWTIVELLRGDMQRDRGRPCFVLDFLFNFLLHDDSIFMVNLEDKQETYLS